MTCRTCGGYGMKHDPIARQAHAIAYALKLAEVAQ